MESENNNEKKKQKIVLLIGLVTLLIAVLGATYAYFQISTDTESSNTNITGSTPPKSLVTLKGVTSNLHLNISASDMSLANATKEYYATDGDEKSYEDNEKDGTKTIADVTLEGGEETTKYSCTAKLTVSRVTEPDEDKDTMIDVLKPGDMILQFKGNIISEKLDLSELKTTGSKEYNLSFKMTGNKVENIQAYIKLLNKNENQNYLAGKKLNIDISTSELKCNVYIPDPKIAELREKDKEVSGWVGHLSTDLQGGMYRYQGTDNVPNWICFGTTENCGTDETDSDGNSIPDGIDKYMYRIIGITEEGQLYLLKETFLKENTATSFLWNYKYLTKNFGFNVCPNGICPEWNEADLFKRLNGTSNGTTQGSGSYSNNTDIFVDSSEYEYLKSGDSNGGESPSEWYNLIADHEWMYGDIGETTPLNTYKGQPLYEIETGNADVKHYVGTDGSNEEETYRWSQKADGKISLMYVHDYYYGYYDGSTEESRGNAGSYSKLKDSWLFFQKDGYNTSPAYEWLSTRYGLESNARGAVLFMCINNGGGVQNNDLQVDKDFGARPVFYLKPDVKIKEGTDGTKTNPFILDVQ